MRVLIFLSFTIIRFEGLNVRKWLILKILLSIVTNNISEKFQQ